MYASLLQGEAGLANTRRGQAIVKLHEERGDHQDGVRGLEPFAAVVAPPARVLNRGPDQSAEPDHLGLGVEAKASAGWYRNVIRANGLI